MEHDAQRVAGHPAQLVQLLGGQSRGAVEGGRGEVARGQRGDGVEGQQVGQGAQLAVLRGGRAEAALPQVLRRGQHGRLVGHAHPDGRPDQDGLEVLGPQHRAQPAAAGVPAVVADRGVADLPLPGRTDGRGLPAASEPLSHGRLGLGRRHPGQLRRGFETGAIAIDEQHRQLRGPPPHDDRVVPGELAGDGEPAGRQRVGEQPGERRLGHDGELRAGRQRRADQWGEHEGQRRVRGQRVDPRRGQPVQQPGAEADAAQIGAQHGVVEGERRARRRTVPDVDHQGPAEVPTGWHVCEGRPAQPPASADRKATVSPATSGRWASRVIWSPLTAATTCRSRVIPTAAAAAPREAARTCAWPPLPAAARAPRTARPAPLAPGGCRAAA